MRKLNLIATALLSLALLCSSGCDNAASATPAKPGSAGMKMLVLGMDGLDPKLLGKLLEEKRMPNFQKVIDEGVFRPLGTAMPPQSPVAWSNFISGARPDTHMIWDFIHRDPAPEGDAPLSLYQSTGDVRPVEVPGYKKMFGESIPWLGGTQLPLYSETELKSFRKGPAFWEALVTGGVNTTIYRMPANYPPPAEIEGRGTFRCLCGMGTPDMLGGYGTFTSFRTDITRDKDVAGGVIRRLELEDNVAVSKLEGPANAFLRVEKGKTPPPLTCEVRFVMDPQAGTVKIETSGTYTVLKKGEWSEWLTVSLESEVPLLGSTMGLSPTAVVRFRATEVKPGVLNVYCSPMQIDPKNPAQPISTPNEWAAEIAEKSGGDYYTTGIPEDTKALRAKPQGLTEDEFLEMVHNLARERHAQFKVALQEFTDGFLFFYFGHTDQLAHVFWRDIDPDHPGRLPEQEGKYDKVIEEAYLEMDVRLGEALAVLDEDDVLMIMSDHGFSSFRRGFNVNTWLERNGYQEWFGTTSRDRAMKYFNINFEQSDAYAVGINSLYLNLKGREKAGTVDPDQYTALLHEIGDKLLEYRDEDGTQVIEKIYYVREEFPGVDGTIAPDMLIGYAANYRGSWSTATGGMSSKIVTDNKDRWSGDHCIAHYLVPGTLVSNRKINVDDPTLSDLAPSVLKLWGLEPMDGMTGRQIFAE